MTNREIIQKKLDDYTAWWHRQGATNIAFKMETWVVSNARDYKMDPEAKYFIRLQSEVNGIVPAKFFQMEGDDEEHLLSKVVQHLETYSIPLLYKQYVETTRELKPIIGERSYPLTPDECMPAGEVKPSIDYKDLLKRYMKLVLESESIDFLHNASTEVCGQIDVCFTKEEIDELKKISDGIYPK